LERWIIFIDVAAWSQAVRNCDESSNEDIHISKQSILAGVT